MTESMTTRRHAISLIASAAAIAPTAALASPADADLIALGARYEPLLRQYIDASAEWAPRLNEAHRRVREELGRKDDEYWMPEHSKALQKFCVENGCDAVEARMSALANEMASIEDIILDADVKSLAGLRAVGLIYLREALPGTSSESELNFETNFERALFYAVADITGIRALADEAEANIAAALKLRPRTGSTVLDHFETQAPAPHITLTPYLHANGWCIKAEAEGFEPLLFGGYAIDERTAHWAAEQVAVHTGCTVPPLRMFHPRHGEFERDGWPEAKEE